MKVTTKSFSQTNKAHQVQSSYFVLIGYDVRCAVSKLKYEITQFHEFGNNSSHLCVSNMDQHKMQMQWLHMIPTKERLTDHHNHNPVSAAAIQPTAALQSTGSVMLMSNKKTSLHYLLKSVSTYPGSCISVFSETIVGCFLVPVYFRSWMQMKDL